MKILKKEILNLKLVTVSEGYTQNCSEEVCIITKIKNTVPWNYVISDLNDEVTAGTFSEKNCKKQIKKNS